MTPRIRRMMKLFFGSALTTIVLGGMMAYTAERATPTPQALDEVEQALEAIAAKHGTAPHKLLQGMMERQLAQPYPLKGGTNVIGKDIFAIPGEERNAFVLGSQRTSWRGAPRAQSELVLLANQSVLASIPMPKNVSPRELTFVLFQPEKVFFVDGESFRVGHLNRPKPE